MERYKLVGFVNLFGFMPDFVIPVFEKGGSYYFGEGNEKSLKLSRFTKIDDDCSHIKRITFLTDIKNNLKRGRELSLESEPLFAFQASEDYVFVGTCCETKTYLRTFYGNMSSEILKEVRDFIDNVGAGA